MNGSYYVFSFESLPIYIDRMNKTLQISLSLISFSFLQSPAWAKNHYADPKYLAKNAIVLDQVMPGAPKPGSTVDIADFEKILAYQKSRTPVDCKRAEAVVDVSLQTLFGPKDGSLTLEQVKNWSSLFEEVRIDTDYFVQEAKKRWQRLRPYLANSSVNPCIHREVTFAYPSGHTAISRVFALLLSEIDPAQKEVFMKRADQIAEDRVVGGVHHPSDLDGGKKLGDAVFQKLKQHPKFAQNLKALIATKNSGTGVK